MAGPSSSRAWMVPLLLTGAAYAAVGWLSLLLALPPGYASPLYPAAGIALACTLRYGWAALPGVALGAFAVNFSLDYNGSLHDLSGLLIPLVVGLGAAAQAQAGAWLVRRHIRQPLALEEGRDALRFYAFGALLACLVSSSLATTALGISGAVPASRLAFTWWTWWLGDALGVLIAAPMVLTLIGEPAEAWRPRRLTVGLPLLGVTLLIAPGILLIGRWEQQRHHADFERDALSAGHVVSARLQNQLDALEAVRGVFTASSDVTGDEFAGVTERWLQLPGLQALGWHQRLAPSEVPAFEARARAEGQSGFKVFNRPDEPPPPAGEVIAMRYIEPMAGNSRALGVNVLSLPLARSAIDIARREGRPVATAGLRLTQETDQQAGVVVYSAVYRGTPSTPEERLARTVGLAFVTLRMEDALQAMRNGLPPHIDLCLVDVTTGAASQRLAGPAGCETQKPDHVTRLSFAGREWQLQVRRGAGTVPPVPWNAWIFSVLGLGATGLLGALLLTMTGRTRRVERAVRERTLALEHEIAERNRTESALRDSQQRLRNILDHVPIGVLYTDLRGVIRESNPRLREMVGYGADELASMTALDFTHPDDRTADIELSGRLVRGEIALFRRRRRYTTKGGHTVWVQSTVSLLRDEQGRPHRIVSVVEDISEHLRLQEAEDARASAEAANRAKSDFLSRMSHELRTPLNAMLGFTQLLELDPDQPLTSKQRSRTAQVQQAGWHLLHMINDTLDLSRIEAGTLRLETRTLEVGPLLSAARSMVDASARNRQIVITEANGIAPLTVRGDETRVKQILTNLLSNAVKYNVDGGRIRIGAHIVAGSAVEISVQDTGPGLTPQQLGELFQPFNRLGRERSGIEGTGIGLVISQRLAEAMGGTLRARSVVGEGSTFVLTLPLAIDIDPTEHELLDETLPNPPIYRRRLVLYVEDNETNAEVMRGILLQRPQVELQVATTGHEGLRAVRARRPHLVLLDMHLPDMDGLELLRLLKEDHDTSDIPVTVVSADAVTTRINAAVSAGATRYLTKPVSVTELLGVVDELLEAQDTRF